MKSDKPWHELGEKAMGEEVHNLLEGYKKEQSGRRSRYIRNLELYEGRSMGGYSAHAYAGSDADDYDDPDRLRLIRSAVESAVASIYAPQKPKPQFQTLGATWATRRKAHRLDRICEGILNQRQERHINAWAFIHSKACPEAALQGVAAIKVMADREQKRVAHALVPHINLFTDPAEGMNPRSLFERGPIDEGLALDKWGRSAAREIRGAPAYEWYGRADTKRPRSSRVIEIQYAWHLPNGTDSPGRWCASIGGKAVDSGDWTAPAFPFAFLIWEPHMDGYWGSGIADVGQALAKRAGELDLRLWYRQLIASGKTIWVPRDSVKPGDLELNDAVKAVMYDGTAPPTESNTPPFHPMEAENRDSAIRQFWDAIGISQVSAAARREQGVSSGVAMMTLNDTKSGRQLPKAQRFEDLFVDLAHQHVWRLRELGEEDADFMVTWPGKTMLQQYNWADNDVEDDGFTVNVAPSANLPHDPAGRQETVQMMYAGGIIDRDRVMELMGWPDTDQELHSAENEYIESLIERYLDAEPDKWNAGEYESPEGFILNKFGALRKFVSAWFRSRMDQRALPEEKERSKAEFCIKLLTRYIRELDALMKPPPAPSAPAGMPPMGAPPMVPPPPPAMNPMAPMPMAPAA